MADDEQSPPEQQVRLDWTGLKITALVAPVFFLFVYLGKAEIGITLSLVLAMAMVAIKLRWELRGYAWFWVTIGLIVALHIPFLSIIHWPHHSSIPTIAFALPLGIADFLLISGALSLAEKLFSKGHSSDEEDG